MMLHDFHRAKPPSSLRIPRSPLLLVCSLTAALLIAAQHSNLFALTPVTEVVVKTGDPAPDGDGTFGTTNAFMTPALNNHGSVGFRGTLNQFARGSGLFLGDGAMLVQVARTNDPALGGNFQGFTGPALDDAGQLLFLSSLVVNSRRFNLIRSEPQPGAFSELLADGQPAPDGNGIVSIANINQPPAFSQSGQTAFVASITNTSGGSTDDSAIYRTGPSYIRFSMNPVTLHSSLTSLIRAADRLIIRVFIEGMGTRLQRLRVQESHCPAAELWFGSAPTLLPT